MSVDRISSVLSGGIITLGLLESFSSLTQVIPIVLYVNRHHLQFSFADLVFSPKAKAKHELHSLLLESELEFASRCVFTVFFPGASIICPNSSSFFSSHLCQQARRGRQPETRASRRATRPRQNPTGTKLFSLKACVFLPSSRLYRGFNSSLL